MNVEERTALQGLLVRLSQGDRAAFEPAFAALWPLLSALCTRTLGDAVAAEDVAQTALCNVFARAGELDPERDAVSWAVGVALWECRTHRRRETRRREDRSEHAGERATSLPDAAANPEEDAGAKELRRALESLIGTLRKSDAEVIEQLLRGEPPEVPRATFRKRAQRAIARLREAWKERHGIE